MAGVVGCRDRPGRLVVANVYITPMYCPDLLGRVSLSVLLDCDRTAAHRAVGEDLVRDAHAAIFDFQVPVRVDHDLLTCTHQPTQARSLSPLCFLPCPLSRILSTDVLTRSALSFHTERGWVSSRSTRTMCFVLGITTRSRIESTVCGRRLPPGIRMSSTSQCPARGRRYVAVDLSTHCLTLHPPLAH